MSALVWWLIPLVACSGALIYVWWSITAKRRQNTYKSIAEYETFRSAFAKDEPARFSKEIPKNAPHPREASDEHQRKKVSSRRKSKTKDIEN